jgi:hypothetical protein
MQAMETLSLTECLFVYMALGGMAWGLLQFGVGALLWAEHKVLIGFGLVIALCGLYLGLLVVYLIVSPLLG